MLLLQGVSEFVKKLLAGVATIYGLIFVGPQISSSFMLRLFSTLSNYTLIAIPLFIFMGVTIEKSGIAGRLYDAMYILFGRLRGGLAIATVLTCTIFATATGVVGATVTVMGIMAPPAMMKYKYAKDLACGSICFLDWLGIVMIIVPLFTPIAVKLGFDPVWFALMNIVVLQTSFLTPPFAYTIFYLKGIAPPEVELTDIYEGVVPFLLLMLI